MAATSLVR